jgi:hypothetical protein
VQQRRDDLEEISRSQRNSKATSSQKKAEGCKNPERLDETFAAAWKLLNASRSKADILYLGEELLRCGLALSLTKAGNPKHGRLLSDDQYLKKRLRRGESSPS